MAEMHTIVDSREKKRHVDKTSDNEVTSIVDDPIYTPIDISNKVLETSEIYTELSSSRLNTGHHPSKVASKVNRFSVINIIFPVIAAAIAVLCCISFIIMIAVMFDKILL